MRTILLGLLAASAASAQPASFQIFGSGSDQVYGTKVSADGVYLAGFVNSANGAGYVWNASGVVYTAGVRIQAVNASGTGAGYILRATSPRYAIPAAMQGGTATFIGELPGGEETGHARDVAENGNIAGWSASANGTEAFIYRNGGLIPLGALPGGAFFASEGWAISDNGEAVVGRATSSTGWQAFRWTEATGMQGLGDLPGGSVSSHAYGVSGDGNVVVGASDNGTTRAFRWTAATGIQPLPSPPGHMNYALAANTDGSVIAGWSSFGTSLAYAAVWVGGQSARSIADILTAEGIDLSGLTLTEATGLSADGRVVGGTALTASGQIRAWRAVLPASAVAADEPARPLPFALRLGANPADAFTDVSFALPAPHTVRVAVYDLLGRCVATPALGALAAGTHVYRLDTRALLAGLYAVRLEADGKTETRLLRVAR